MLDQSQLRSGGLLAMARILVEAPFSCDQTPSQHGRCVSRATAAAGKLANVHLAPRRPAIEGYGAALKR